jgi:hypothetical protein
VIKKLFLLIFLLVPTAACAGGVNATFANLHAQGSIGFVGTSNNGTDSITGICKDGVCPVTAWGAKCDKSTDDTSAIQAAGNYAFSHYDALYLPGTCVVSQLAFTGYYDGQVRMYGATDQGGGSTGGTSGGTTGGLLCREAAWDTGVCVDLTNTQRWTMQNMRVGSQGAGSQSSCAATSTCPPQITVLFSETSFPSNNSQVAAMDGVTIDNNGGGDYAYYDYGGEVTRAIHSYFSSGAVAAILLTSTNAAGITSPTLGALAAGPVSESLFQFRDSIMDNGGGPIIAMEGFVQNVTIDGVYVNTNTSSPGFITDLHSNDLTQNLTINNVRQETISSQSMYFGKFPGQVEGIHMTNDSWINAGPGQPAYVPLQFNYSSGLSVTGGEIQLIPGQNQNTYPSGNTVSCAFAASGVIFDSVDATGGAPLSIGCPGMAVSYNGTVYDSTVYVGATIPSCAAMEKFSEKWVSDGKASPTYGGTYASGDGTAIAKVGCDGTNWRYGY